VRRTLLLAVTTAVVLLASGCGGGSEVEVGVGDGAATVTTGDTLRVDLGAANPSVGDSWHLIGPPDPAVLTDRGDDYTADCDMPGCGGSLAWRFAAAGKGQTTLVFRYCYRSGPDDCQPAPDRGPATPVALTVTVG